MAQSLPEPDIQRAIAFLQSGRSGEAESLCNQLLSAKPEHPDALHILGVIAAQRRRFTEAQDLLNRSIAINPNNHLALSDAGNVARELGHLDLAIERFQNAVRLAPDNPIARYNLGCALRARGDIGGAINAFQHVLRLNSQFAEAQFALGAAYVDARQFQNAIPPLQYAIRLRPAQAPFHNALAAALRGAGQPDAAIAAALAALKLNPNLAEAHHNLACARAEKSLFDQALPSLQDALRINPQFAAAWTSLGNVFKELGRLDESVAAYRRAVELDPSPQTHSMLILTMHYHASTTPHELAGELALWNNRHALPSKPRHAPPRASPANRRPRIGYVSSDFCAHPCAFFLLPLLRAHNKQAFEIFCYADPSHTDEITGHMRAAAEHWHPTNSLADHDLAALIRRHQIDILVDLKLHTFGHRLLTFAQKPAPIQLTWLGYPGSTGLTAIDYRLTDHFLEPTDSPDLFSAEKALRLPHCFWCFDPLESQTTVQPPPALSNGHITFGSLNSFYKISHPLLDSWSQILAQVPTSRLLMIAPEGRCREETLRKLNVSPERITFQAPVARRDYLALYHKVDLALDSFPFTGGTTTFDALWMGVPVLTRAGQFPHSRSAFSILSNLSLSDFITHTPDQYITRAIELAQNLPLLTQTRLTLRPLLQSSPLMNPSLFAQNLESLYTQLAFSQ